METVRSPDWLIRRWPDIVKAAMEIGEWANGYSHGYIKADEGDFPADGPPTLVPLWRGSDGETSWIDWPHKDLYASVRVTGYALAIPGLTHEQRKERVEEVKAGQWEGSRFLEREYLEYHFGTYNVFRVLEDELRVMNEGYEDQAGSENERILEDGDWRIVVYMS